MLNQFSHTSSRFPNVEHSLPMSDSLRMFTDELLRAGGAVPEFSRQQESAAKNYEPNRGRQTGDKDGRYHSRYCTRF